MGTALKDRLREAMDGPPKVSQAAVARACKISAASVNDWLSGKSKAMEGRNLIATAKLLKVNPEWLQTGKGPKVMPRANGVHAAELTLAKSPGQVGPLSHFTGPDPDILHEAVLLLLFDLDHGGSRSARSTSDLLLTLYRRIEASGGRMPEAEQEAFEDAARSRGQAKQAGATHAPGKTTTKPRRAG